MALNYNKLGDYIIQTDLKNTDLSVSLLLGVGINKCFIESHANTIGTDFSTYKIVKRGEFAYCPVTSRNGDKISIAILKEADECLVSSSYIPFKISKPNELDADYLMLIFKNQEFDRYSRYNSWGSAREVFSWEEFCETLINVPTIGEQKEIVDRYNSINSRVVMLQEQNEQLEKMADCLFKQCLLDNNLFESTIGEIGEFVRGKNITAEEMIPGQYDVISAGLSPSGTHNSFNVEGPSITISGSGVNAGYVSLHLDNIWAADCSFCNVSKNIYFLYGCLKYIEVKINELKDGHSAQPHVYPKDVNVIKINVPSKEIIHIIESKLSIIYNQIYLNKKEIKELNRLSTVLIETMKWG